MKVKAKNDLMYQDIYNCICHILISFFQARLYKKAEFKSLNEKKSEMIEFLEYTLVNARPQKLLKSGVIVIWLYAQWPN